MTKQTKEWQDNYNIENLIFEGGGVKGVSYGGALTTMDGLGLLGNVKRCGGTSAGAITACLMALGYTPKEIAKIVVETKFSSFKDDSFGVMRDMYRLITKYGWHKGDAFNEWLSSYVQEKLGSGAATFRDLSTAKINMGAPFKDLYVVITNFSKQRAEVYSAETTPDKSIVEAVRTSMSIPMFFQCVRNADGDILVDGGVANNFPIRLFDQCKYIGGDLCESDMYRVNPNTLGFRLDTKEEIEANEGWKNAHIEIANIQDYAVAFVTYLMEMANKRHLKDCDRERTIFIETGDIKAMDFDLDPAKVQMLIENGQNAVYEYFNCSQMSHLSSLSDWL
jgi:NTE family protein